MPSAAKAPRAGPHRRRAGAPRAGKPTGGGGPKPCTIAEPALARKVFNMRHFRNRRPFLATDVRSATNARRAAMRSPGGTAAEPPNRQSCRRAARTSSAASCTRDAPAAQAEPFTRGRRGRSGRGRGGGGAKRGPSRQTRLIGYTVEVVCIRRRSRSSAGGRVLCTMPRLRDAAGHRIDHRHVTGSLVRKPGVFARYRFREELFPSPPFRAAYDAEWPADIPRPCRGPDRNRRQTVARLQTMAHSEPRFVSIRAARSPHAEAAATAERRLSDCRRPAQEVLRRALAAALAKRLLATRAAAATAERRLSDCRRPAQEVLRRALAAALAKRLRATAAKDRVSLTTWAPPPNWRPAQRQAGSGVGARGSGARQRTGEIRQAKKIPDRTALRSLVTLLAGVIGAAVGADIGNAIGTAILPARGAAISAAIGALGQSVGADMGSWLSKTSRS